MNELIYNPWTGQWEPLNPSTTTNTPTTTKKTGFDWLTTILTGATGILGQLFPNGLNNSGSPLLGGTTGGTTPGYVPVPTQAGSSSTNGLVFFALGLAVLFLLNKNKD